jgi:hypothetical protein
VVTFVRAQEIEHEIGPAGSFSLRVTDAEVELRAARDGVARVRATFNIRADSDIQADEILERVSLVATTGPGSLDVSEPRPPRGLSGLGALAQLLTGRGGSVSLRVEAAVPAECRVRMSGVSAELTAIGLRGQQHYNTVSGDLVLTDAGGAVKLNCVSGDVSIRSQGPLEVEATTVSGDLSVVAPEYGLVRINTVSGDVELEGRLAEGRSHRVETVSGDLSLGITGGLTLEVRSLSSDVDLALPHRSEGSRDRRRYTVGDGAAELLFSSMSGDVSVGGSQRAPPPPPAPAPPAPPRPAILPDTELEVLRALERGEIDVEEAARRLSGDDGR